MIFTVILIAAMLNYNCKKDLLLSLVIGLSVLLPMHLLKDYYYVWYAVCIGSEAIKALLGYFLNTKMKYPLIFIETLMIACHGTSYYFDGASLPYRSILPVLEYVELLICILFSIPVLNLLKREVLCLLR